MKKRSTVLQLLKVFDDITDKIEKGLPVDIIYTDFTKAFDTVPHNRLLYKLERYGIAPTLLRWIKSFLTYRQQRVKIKNVQSKRAEVLSGVPQGSVLGPLLFIIYINDIVDDLKCNTFLYADDMKIFTEIQSPLSKIQL